MTQIKTSQRKGKASLAALTASSNMSDTAVLTSTGAFTNTGAGHNFAKESGIGICVSDISQYNLVRESGTGLAVGLSEYDLARESSSGNAMLDMSNVTV